MSDEAKPYTLAELASVEDDPMTMRVVKQRLRATVEALEKAEERIDCYGLGDEACGDCLRCLNERWKSELHRRLVAEKSAEKAEAERDEARACIADALSVLLDPATSGEHWSILPSVVENLRDERDAMKATVNDALEQLRHEEHLRTTAERAVAEAAERLDEFGACPTLADGVHAMRLRLVEARAEVARLREALLRAIEDKEEGIPYQRTMGWNKAADFDEKLLAEWRAALAGTSDEEGPRVLSSESLLAAHRMWQQALGLEEGPMSPAAVRGAVRELVERTMRACAKRLEHFSCMCSEHLESNDDMVSVVEEVLHGKA